MIASPMTPTERERQAHVAGIVADPGCDTRRLVFADWCEENGEEILGSYIRENISNGRCYTNTSGEPSVVAIIRSDLSAATPCELSEVGKMLANGIISAETARNMFGLVYAHIPFAPAIPGVAWTVRRGFAEGVTLSAEDWARMADDLIAEYPIQSVELTTYLQIAIRSPWRDRKTGWDASLGVGILGYDRFVPAPSEASHPGDILQALWPSIPLAGWKLPAVPELHRAPEQRASASV